MNTLVSVKQLDFHVVTEPEAGDYYLAKTPFGNYEYHREHDEIVAIYCDSSDMFRGRFKNAVEAQLACNKHFTSRIKECLEIQ